MSGLPAPWRESSPIFHQYSGILGTCSFNTHLQLASEPLAGGGGGELLGLMVWRVALLGQSPPKKKNNNPLRNERGQQGKHQVTALKGLSHLVTDHPACFTPGPAAWGLPWLSSWGFALLTEIPGGHGPQSLQGLAAGQTENTNEGYKGER